ncbi:RNA-directed DNA polymerase from transposon X-element [Ceratobasidium sp. AG-Ba]|nr:RNA-directed DNA polymerase from transposon X-element [Ceratobasidium sp. AG-Ba]QRV91736.1 RNA-directed DNA polymerase from transposon X-element [Ceratobasidium sp. AG-Ba]
MMTRRGGALDWLKLHNSTFELDKTGLIHFSRKKIDRPSLTVDRQLICPADSHTLLGVVLDQGLRFRQQCHKALAKGLAWTSQVGRVARMSCGAPPRIVRKLYVSIAVPRFTYAADVWFTQIRPPKEGSTRYSGSTGFANKLLVIQSLAARVILGALRSTPIAHLNAFSSLLPVQYLLNEVCQRAAIRLATVPNLHPLRKEVAHILRVNRKSHTSPMHNLLRYIEQLPVDLEQWSFKNDRVPPLTIPKDYFASRSTTTWAIRTEHARTKVYADGARNKHGTGAGAVLRVHERTSAWTGFRLGDRDQATILEAELVGIWLAFHLVHRLRYVEEAVVYSDSQLAIACVEGVASGAPKNLVSSIRALRKTIEERRDCIRINLEWCPAHDNILGNVLADQEARGAAKGDQYKHDLIPRGLHRYKRRMTQSIAKIALKEDNRIFAARGWAVSGPGKKLLAKYPSIDPSKFLQDTAHLRRGQITLLFRLITGHVQLNLHLHTLQLVDSPACQACGAAIESVSHFVLRCPKYAAIRQQVLTSRGRNFLSLSFLFSTRSGITALLEYVRRTHRFDSLT